MERFVQFPTGDNWTFTRDSPILWKQLNLARYLVLSTWYLVSGTWTQPVLGQDFTVLWLATLGRGINIMMRRSGRPAGARCYASLYWFPYQESVSQILEKKNQDFTGSAPDSLRAITDRAPKFRWLQAKCDLNLDELQLYPNRTLPKFDFGLSLYFGLSNIKNSVGDMVGDPPGNENSKSYELQSLKLEQAGKTPPGTRFCCHSCIWEYRSVLGILFLDR